ncbi:PstS family phosphate ABC transporter substrate-binding protein [Marinicella sediminis]|uniref:PstS family phosphate ABC transporter substrate-binding protein n=1 Tax=Marinicella sediminis TaxID=1792834 RepID=A0ABV7J438_9GAMM|nr:PstS family phosphate ABC transporter substrate-binding protein [Marinicella sediminis]
MKTLNNYLFEILISVFVALALLLLFTDGGEPEATNRSDPGVESPMSSQSQQPIQPAVVPAPGLAPDLLATEPEVILRLHGSNTIGGKLAPAIAAAYLRQLGSEVTVSRPLEQPNEVEVIGYLPPENTVVSVQVKAHGSSTGFKALIAKQADIAMSSRSIREAENLQLLLDQGDMTQPQSEHILALDGLAIVTHPDNLTASITVKQLADVFSGRITNWQQLGGADLAITLYARDDQSGTFDTFAALVLNKYGRQLASANRYESNARLVAAVADDQGGIGFTGLAYAKPGMLISVAADEGLPAIKPRQFSISSEDYALSRRLFLYANKSLSGNPHVGDFIDFALSDQGHQLVEHVNFIPQKITSTLPLVTHEHPARYQQLALNGERLSVTFRMRADRAEIDNKSAQDIEHLVEYLKQTPHQKVALIGFSAVETNDEADKLRSRIRSQLLAYELKTRGIHAVEIIALGNQLPIDSNQHEWGRYRNNRTEIWVIKGQNNS